MRGDERIERPDRRLTEGRANSAKVGGSSGVERQNILEPRHELLYLLHIFRSTL